jgi:hypothetical protein
MAKKFLADIIFVTVLVTKGMDAIGIHGQL